LKGNLLRRNPTAEQLKTFVHNEIEYSTEILYIATQIDFDKELDFETQTNGKEYSLYVKLLYKYLRTNRKKAKQS
jgi:hypothetical protein